MRTVFVVVFLVGLVCVEKRVLADDAETVQASIDSINEADLGRPYTATFSAVTGKEAKTVYPMPAGKAWMTAAGETGELKLRVRDNKHTDNKGAFKVTITVVPEDMLKADCQNIDAQGSASPCQED